MRLIIVCMALGVSCNAVSADDLEKAVRIINGLNQAFGQQPERWTGPPSQQQWSNNWSGPPRQQEGPSPVESARQMPESDGNTIQGNSGYSDYSGNQNHQPQSNYRPQYRPQNNGTYVYPIQSNGGSGYYQNGQYIHYSNGGSFPQNTYQNYSTPAYTTPTYAEPPVAPIRYSNLPIAISCPSDSDGICNYELMSASGKVYPYSISSGLEQKLTESTSWSIRYEPSPGQPKKIYKLRGGKSYSLQRDSAGLWQFYTLP